MTPKSKLQRQQREWAEARGLDPDRRNYLPEVAANLYAPMTATTQLAFERGSGSELKDSPSRPAKMRALHSSSALAVNFFDHWTDRDKAPLQESLQLDAGVGSISFEAQFPTGLPGTPPNLDVVLDLSDGVTIGIESKLSEWLSPAGRARPVFKPKYFADGPDLWAALGLRASQQLASDIHAGKIEFQYLNAAQLLKHALGLATQLGNGFRLFYIYLDWPSPESRRHRRELDQFTDIVGVELGFRALTYQNLLTKLETQPAVDPAYSNYLRERYCPA